MRLAVAFALALLLPIASPALATHDHDDPAILLVRVNALGGDATFPFASNGADPLPTLFSLTSKDGGAERTFIDLVAGRAYAVWTMEKPGWRTVSSWCTTGTPARIVLAGGAEATCTFNLTRLAEVRGLVYRDADHDGRLDLGETKLSGWTVYADLDRDAVLDVGEARVKTGADGTYSLGGLDPGTIHVRLAVPGGWEAIAPSGGVRNLTLAAAEVRTSIDFGALGPLPVAPGDDGDDDEDDEGTGPGRAHAWRWGWGTGHGHWKHGHRHVAAADLASWLDAIADDSWWLADDAHNLSTARALLGSAVSCRGAVAGDAPPLDEAACERARFEARYLAFRIAVASSLLPEGATLQLDAAVADALGLDASVKVSELIAAIEDERPATLDADEYRAIRSALRA